MAGVALLVLFTTRYRMPFRLDDVLLMLWAKTHSIRDAFDPVRGQMINSFRPVFSLTAFALTHLAGWDHPFWWHLTLDVSLLTGIAFTGLTARYLAGRWYVLELTIALYFVAFLPILNIFFWYSDLTFGLELAFTAMVWYFGLRGLYEARPRLWYLAMVLGIFAVLSKEPAFVLVHVVVVGSFLLERKSVLDKWKSISSAKRNAAIVSYAILLGISLWVALVSPTRTNRFFSLSSPGAGYFIRDRVEYYSALYFSPMARLLLFTPFVYVLLRAIVDSFARLSKGIRFWFLTIFAAVLSLLIFQNVLIALPLLVFIFVFLQGRNSTEQRIIRRLLPFLACILIAMGALLVTVQLVKTQLTEVAFLTALLSAWAWSIWGEDLAMALAPYTEMPKFRWTAYGIAVLFGILVLAGVWRRVWREERLLSEVRAVREDANSAVAWIAHNLPPHSLLAVARYSLYGIDGPGALTPEPDETKLADQYTFDGGFVFDALNVLGRPDFRRTYLADSALLPRVVDAMRGRPRSYVLLQSKLDFDRFHGIGYAPILQPGKDTLVAHFAQGPYPCEVWELKN